MDQQAPLIEMARHSIIEGMRDGVIILDSQDRIVDINPAARHLLVAEDLDLVGAPLARLVAEDSDLIAHLHADSKTPTETSLGEQGRTFEVTVSVQRDQRGEPTGRVIVLHDTYSLRQAERALDESRQQLEEQKAALGNLSLLKQTDDALSNLLELSRVLTGTRDMSRALVQAVQSATAIVPSADRGTLQWLDSDGETLRTVAVSDAGSERIDVLPFRLGEGVAGHALASKQIINVPDVRTEARFVPGQPGVEFRSLLVAPLVVKARALGTLSLSSVQGNAFSATDETLAGLIADQIAVALENAQEFTARQEAEMALQAQRERVTIQHEIVQSILAARLPETIAVAVIGRIRKLIPCQRAMVFAIGEEGQLKLLAAESSAESAPMADESAYQELRRVPSLTSGWVHGAQDLETLARRTALQDILYRSGVRSYAVVPLFIQGEVVGTLNLESGKAAAFGAEHIAIATEVAASLALAMRQARLYERAQQEIAERMQAEEALRLHASELEARNAELDAFAHTVAHDLKSPVSTILGYCDILTQKLSSLCEGEAQQFLRAIERSSMRMGTIIDELLLLASVRGMAEVEFHRLDTAWIVNEVLERFRYAIKEQEAEIVLPERWPEALGYGPWVEEVWVNYVSNALKYGGTPPRIELGAAPDRDGAQIRFWVHDNGNGLSPEEQARLFAPFERLHHVRVAGHGLGLSIVQRIIQRLGGEVGVESEFEAGKGSTFYFTLPAAPLDAADG